MDSLQFCHWLQGFAEFNKEPPTDKQWEAIRLRLDSVFINITPKTVYRDSTNLKVRPPEIFKD